MTEDQKTQCHVIIHSHAILGAAGNTVPVPGLGLAIDTVTMTTMTMALAVALGGNVSKAVAEGMAIQAIKTTVLKSPLRMLCKEAGKLIPYAGQALSASISAGILEAAGWSIADQLDKDIQQEK